MKRLLGVANLFAAPYVEFPTPLYQHVISTQPTLREGRGVGDGIVVVPLANHRSLQQCLSRHTKRDILAGLVDESIKW